MKTVRNGKRNSEHNVVTEKCRQPSPPPQLQKRELPHNGFRPEWEGRLLKVQTLVRPCFWANHWYREKLALNNPGRT